MQGAWRQEADRRVRCRVVAFHRVLAESGISHSLGGDRTQPRLRRLVELSAVARARRPRLMEARCITCATFVSVGNVASRALRNNTRELLERVESGEEVTITVDGRAVATLQPVGSRPRWMPKAAFLDLIVGHQADPGLAEELHRLAPDTTDDLR